MLAKYGAAPDNSWRVDISPVEMMFWLYCPIKLPGTFIEEIPHNLEQFCDLVDVVFSDLSASDVWRESYVYITAKTLWVTPDNLGNRAGWHCDGFMTDDLNYIWCDRSPTEFFITDDPVMLTQDHSASVAEMDNLVASGMGKIVSGEPKRLYRLDERVIHRVAETPEPGMRTFVKISVSKHLYSHIGNSINHGLNYERPNIQRGRDRNCPATTPTTHRKAIK